MCYFDFSKFIFSCIKGCKKDFEISNDWEKNVSILRRSKKDFQHPRGATKILKPCNSVKKIWVPQNSAEYFLTSKLFWSLKGVWGRSWNLGRVQERFSPQRTVRRIFNLKSLQEKFSISKWCKKDFQPQRNVKKIFTPQFWKTQDLLFPVCGMYSHLQQRWIQPIWIWIYMYI